MRRSSIMAVLLVLLFWGGLAQAATLFFSDGLEAGFTWGIEDPGSVDRCTTSPHTGSWAMCANAGMFGPAFQFNVHTSVRAYVSFWQRWPTGTTLGPDQAAHWWRFYSNDPDVDGEWECVSDFVPRTTSDANPQFNMNWTVYGGPGGCPGGQGDYEIVSPYFTVRDGNWHHIEVFYENNPASDSTSAGWGWMQFWSDGVLLIDVTNMRDGTVPHYGYTFALPSNIGGTGFVYFDDIEVWSDCPTSLTFGGGTPSCATGPDVTPPSRTAGAPTGSLAFGTTSTQIRLTALDSTGPVTCKYDTDGGESYAAMANTLGTSACAGGSTHCSTVSGLTNGGNYTYYVRCQDSAGTPNPNPDDFSITFSVASGTVPSPPTNLRLTSTTTMSLGVAWDSASGATGYRLYECHTSPSCTPNVLLSDTATLAYPHVKLVPSTSYRYTVTAYNTNGESAASSVVTGTTTQVGLAQAYAHDVGIDVDGRVVWYEDFEEAGAGTNQTTWRNTLAARYHESQNITNISYSTDVPTNAAASSHSAIFAEDVATNSPELYRLMGTTGWDQLFVRYYIKFAAGSEYGHSSVWIGGWDPPKDYKDIQASSCNQPTRIMGAFENSEPTIPADRWDAYLYWPSMHPDGSGQCWGNDLFNQQTAVTFDTWHSVEVMVKLNSAPYSTTFDGEYAVWLNGTKYGHYGQGFPTGQWVADSFLPGPSGVFEGFRWRTADSARLNYVWIQHFESGENSLLRYDQVVVATEYIGPLAASASAGIPASPLNLRVVQP